MGTVPNVEMADRNSPDQDDDLEADILYEDDILKVCDEGSSEENGLNEELTDMDIATDATEVTEDESGSHVNDNSVFTFKEHQGSVFAVCIHPQERLACTGSEDETAYVWNTDTGSILFKCEGHKESVTCTSFSCNGAYLATGDMGGLIQVWKTENQQCINKFDVDELEWIAWHSTATVLLAGTATGDVWMWLIPNGDCKVMPGQGVASTCGACLSDGKRLLCGYADGAVKIWDLKAVSPVVSWSGQGQSLHTSQVNCVAAHENGFLGISGSEDCSAKLINCSTGKVMCDLQAENIKKSVESADFCRSLPLAAIGSLDGAVGVWDVSVGTLREICHAESGIVKIMWSRGAPLLYSASLDGLIHLWDGRTAKRERTWSGHTDSILDVALNEELAILVSGSDDQSCKVFQI